MDTVPEAEMSTQTDPFIDRPPSPLFIPQKSGVDAITQIEQGNAKKPVCTPVNKQCIFVFTRQDPMQEIHFRQERPKLSHSTVSYSTTMKSLQAEELK